MAVVPAGRVRRVAVLTAAALAAAALVIAVSVLVFTLPRSADDQGGNEAITALSTSSTEPTQSTPPTPQTTTSDDGGKSGIIPKRKALQHQLSLASTPPRPRMKSTCRR